MPRVGMDNTQYAIEDKHGGEEVIATDLEHVQEQIAMTRNLKQAFDFSDSNGFCGLQ